MALDNRIGKLEAVLDEQRPNLAEKIRRAREAIQRGEAGPQPKWMASAETIQQRAREIRAALRRW